MTAQHGLVARAAGRATISVPTAQVALPASGPRGTGGSPARSADTPSGRDLSRRAWTAALAATMIVLLTAGCGGADAPSGSAGPSVSRTPRPFHGVTPDEATSRPSFTLTDTSGASFDFAAHTRGRPTYLYFGYTNCPDECPTAMADLAAALRKAPAADRAKAVVVLVTTDPARDSGPVLRRFLDQFSTDFIGLRGTQAQVDAAQQAAGIPLGKPEGPIPTISGDPSRHPHKTSTVPHTHAGPLGYSVSHAALILAYDVSDMLPVAYPGGVTASDIAADLPLLLNR